MSKSAFTLGFRSLCEFIILTQKGALTLLAMTASINADIPIDRYGPCNMWAILAALGGRLKRLEILHEVDLLASPEVR